MRTATHERAIGGNIRVMKIGIGLPAYIPNVEGSIILDWARQADNGPFSSLGVLDRLTYGNYEPLVALAAAAGATKRIRLMTTVLLAPIRNTVMLAKQSASLDSRTISRSVAEKKDMAES